MHTENGFETLSDDAFAHLGRDNVAYIKKAIIDGGTYYVLTSAAGEDLLAVGSRDEALAEAYERELVALTRH